MPSLQINSTNINTFNFTASFDIKNKQVIFNASGTTYNGASGSGDLYVQGIAFSLIDQDGIQLATIDWTNPQIPLPANNSVYTLDLSQVNQSFLFQTYSIVGAIKDQDGTVYMTLPVYKKICKPMGLSDNGTVDGNFQLIADCVNNSLTVKELTTFAFNNQLPITTTKSGTLFYPTGTIVSIPFTATPFSNNYIVTGDYLINNTSIATYDLGDGCYQLIAYYTYNNYSITCTNTMSDVLCCLMEVQNEMMKNCGNAKGEAAKDKLTQATIPLISGFIAEQSGMDASNQAKEVRNILGCSCGYKQSNQNELTPINPSIYSIVLLGAGGTKIPSASVNGNTKTWTISSVSSSVSKGNTSDLGWSIKLDTSTTNVNNYQITFNYPVIAGYILTAIAASSTLTAQLKAIVNGVFFDNYLVHTVPYLICGSSPITLYSSNAFGVGQKMYFDSALTRPVTGYTLITQFKHGFIYTIDSTTGIVGASTGNNC